MNITILDVETTGVSAAKHTATEVAGILYNLDEGTELACFSTLLRTGGMVPDVPADVADLTGITTEMIKQVPTDTALMAEDILNIYVHASQYLLAYNYQFDKSFLEAGELLPNKYDAKWVCAMRHIRWPRASKNRTLTEVAVANGVPVLSAHRALTDCKLLSSLLTRMHDTGTDLVKLFKDCSKPTKLVQALINKEDTELREAAKKAGFEWNHEERYPYRWTKHVRVDDKDVYPFKIQVLL